MNSFKYQIIIDEDPISPRELDPPSVLAIVKNRYFSGDQNISEDCLYSILKDKNIIALPVYAYIHSGVTISTEPFSCSWDSGLAGVIYYSKEFVRNNWHWKRLTENRIKKIKEWLKAEVEEYNKYLNGECYGFVIKDEKDAVVENCFGFYSREEAEEEAKMVVKRLFDDEQEKENNKIPALSEGW